MRHYLKKFFIFLLLIFPWIAYADIAMVDESFIAGQDALVGNNISVAHDLSSVIVMHVISYENDVVFLKPKELIAASHMVRKKLTEKSHLTNIVVDQSYLTTLATIIADPDRRKILRSWKQINAAPILAVVLVPSENFSQTPIVTTSSFLSGRHINWLLQRAS